MTPWSSPGAASLASPSNHSCPPPAQPHFPPLPPSSPPSAPSAYIHTPASPAMPTGTGVVDAFKSQSVVRRVLAEFAHSPTPIRSHPSWKEPPLLSAAGRCSLSARLYPVPRAATAAAAAAARRRAADPSAERGPAATTTANSEVISEVQGARRANRPGGTRGKGQDACLQGP